MKTYELEKLVFSLEKLVFFIVLKPQKCLVRGSEGL